MYAPSLKRSSSLRIPPDRSGCLPDELFRRNFELNMNFVVLANLDSVDQRRDDHMLGFDAGLIVPFNPGQDAYPAPIRIM